eukprot:Seg20830.1 transcript_id=Seg20830.1/GoldUCD/mRNA.D3Y31 product="hypothetical protein" protein_id=Seg20830.1/GoldUCD/D3Y31
MELAIQIKGEIVNSNFDAFKANCLERIEGMKYELLTDDDFKKAKEDIKSLKESEDALKIAKEEALKQMDEVYALMGGIDEIVKASSECRLEKSREVKKRDAEIKEKIIDDALQLIDHPYRETFREKVTLGAKGKRSFTTMKKGAEEVAKNVYEDILATRGVLLEFANEHGKTLIQDGLSLELLNADSVASELRHRLEKQRDEEEKARLKAEAEKAKAEAEAEKARTQAKIEQDKREREAKEVSASVTSQESKVNEGSKPDKASGQDAHDPLPETAPPVPTQEETAEQEMARFTSIVVSAFAPVKEARAQLKHQENIEAAEEFANGLSDSWAIFKSKNQ